MLLCQQNGPAIAHYSGPYLEKNDWGANTDRMPEGHCEGEGDVPPSCAEHEAETTSILQSEWEAKKRSIATIIICTCSCCVALSMETEKIKSGGRPPSLPPT